MSSEKDLYFVAVKLLVRKDGKLLITHDIFGSWDIPGGRIQKSEFDRPLEDVLARKAREELGDTFKFKLGVPTVFFRVERKEHGLGGQLVHIFAVGYEATYVSGEVKLGKHHDKMEWVDIKTFDPKQYFTGGWLQGIEEYLYKNR